MSSSSAVHAKQRLIQKLQDGLLQCDFQWSCFVAAVFSYRHDTVLRPFPPMYVTDSSEKDIDTLRSVVETVPSFQTVITSKCSTLTAEAQTLVEWVLNERNYKVAFLEKTKFLDIKEKTGQTVPATVPQYLFEVSYSDASENQWAETRGSRDIIYAYHGTRVENIHSILHSGLNSNMNKVSVFGEGTYLSKELSVSINWSPMVHGWRYSNIGHRLSCVTVCQIIDHPDVKFQTQSNDNSDVDKNRARASNSMAGDVPETYFIVENNQLLRVKYILVYAENEKSKTFSVSWYQSWFYRHRFLLMMLSYLMILIAIGLANSKSFNVWYRKNFSRFYKSSINQPES